MIDWEKPIINISKPVRTKCGLRVVNLKRVPINSAGRKVTFPIKGTIILREKSDYQRQKTEYGIWTDNGRFDVLSKHYMDIENF